MTEAIRIPWWHASRIAKRWRRRLRPIDPAPAEWYDRAYAASDEYARHYSESAYMVVWEGLLARLKAPCRVLEVGCGSGQLAHFLVDRGLLASYVGFDFSPVAIEAARQRCPDLRFEVADAFTTDLFDDDYDLVLCTEVLEHVQEDRGLLERIRPGTRVLATVPDFVSDSHVRWFPKVRHVRRRYGNHLAQLEVEPRKHERGLTYYVLDGVTPGRR